MNTKNTQANLNKHFGPASIMVVKIQHHKENIRIGFPDYLPFTYVKLTYLEGAFEFNFSIEKQEGYKKIGDKPTDRVVRCRDVEVLKGFRSVGFLEHRKCKRFKALFTDKTTAFLSLTVGLLR